MVKFVKEKPKLIVPPQAPGRKTSGGGDLKLFVQKEGLTCGIFTMPPGTRLSTKEAPHPGDEVYYVVKGPAYCDLPEEDYERVEIPEGHAFHIPANTKHIANNIPGKEEAIVLFICTNWP